MLRKCQIYKLRNTWTPLISCFSLLHKPRIENRTLTTWCGWLWKNSMTINCYSLLCKNSTNAWTTLISFFWLLHKPMIKNMMLSRCYGRLCKNWRLISSYLLLCKNSMTKRMPECLWLKPCITIIHFLRCVSWNTRFLLTCFSANMFLNDFESPRTSMGMSNNLLKSTLNKILDSHLPHSPKSMRWAVLRFVVLICCHKWLPHTKRVIPRTERLHKLNSKKHIGCVR